MVIFPFVQNTSLTRMGYRLVCCDPLYEKKVSNFDALIARYTKKVVDAIFVEVKTSDKHLPGLVDEMIEKQNICEQHREYILKNYLGTDLPCRFEYVVCGYSYFVDDIQAAIVQKFSDGDKSELNEKKLVVWKADKWKSSLGLTNPGKNVIKQQMLHSDSNLNTELSKGYVVSHRILTFFPQSHIVTKIKSIAKMLISMKVIYSKTEFDTKEVKDFLENELYYLKTDTRDELMQKILDVSEKIGIIQNLGFGSYKLTKEYSGSSLNERIVEKLWIEYKVKEEQTRKIDQYTQNLREQTRTEDENTPRLDRYIEK
jgi:hypothetical protein